MSRARVLPQRFRYLASLSEELLSQANRVRDLIGDRHWFSDGHHKEQLLASVLRRHLPADVIVSRGFVIDPSDAGQCSKEQDILVVNAHQEAPIFRQGDLIICFPRTVLAAISVKTRMDRATVLETIDGLNSVRNVLCHLPDPGSAWCAGFFYETDASISTNPRIVESQVAEGLQRYPCRRPSLPTTDAGPFGPNFFCGVTDLVYRLSYEQLPGAHTSSETRLLGYRCPEVAAALFLAQLLDHVASARGLVLSEISDFVEEAETDLVVNSPIDLSNLGA
jgi:hypothetical protein